MGDFTDNEVYFLHWGGGGKKIGENGVYVGPLGLIYSHPCAPWVLSRFVISF